MRQKLHSHPSHSSCPSKEPGLIALELLSLEFWEQTSHLSSPSSPSGPAARIMRGTCLHLHLELTMLQTPEGF